MWAKRVGGKVKADSKAEFTETAIVNIGASQMAAPVVVYNRTNLKDAKHPTATIAYKYKNWRRDFV